MARLVNLCDRINSENLSPLNELLQIRNVRAGVGQSLKEEVVQGNTDGYSLNFMLSY